MVHVTTCHAFRGGGDCLGRTPATQRRRLGNLRGIGTQLLKADAGVECSQLQAAGAHFPFPLNTRASHSNNHVQPQGRFNGGSQPSILTAIARRGWELGVLPKLLQFTNVTHVRSSAYRISPRRLASAPAVEPYQFMYSCGVSFRNCRSLDHRKCTQCFVNRNVQGTSCSCSRM